MSMKNPAALTSTDGSEIEVAATGADLTVVELLALAGVSSGLQSQLDGKLAKNVAITGATKTKVTYDANGLVTAGADATKSDVGLSSVTNDAQLKIASNLADLNNAATARSNLGLGTMAVETAANYATKAGWTASRALEISSGGSIQASAVTAAELGYLSGVTSGIQTQLNARALLAGAAFTGPISAAASVGQVIANSTATNGRAEIIFAEAGTNKAGLQYRCSANGTNPNEFWFNASLSTGAPIKFFVSWSGTPALTIDATTGNVGIKTPTPTAALDVLGDVFRLRTAKTPASASASGNQGDLCWDASYFYICTATNTWLKIPLYKSVTPAQLTADTNNYAPSVGTLWRLSTDASRKITGLNVGQWDGQEHVIFNVGSNDLVLAHQDTNSTAAYRFISTTGADITLTAGQAARLYYDGTSLRWRVTKLG